MERYEQINFVTRGMRIHVNGPREQHNINRAWDSMERQTIAPHHPFCGSITDDVTFAAARLARAESEENA